MINDELNKRSYLDDYEEIYLRNGRYECESDDDDDQCDCFWYNESHRNNMLTKGGDDYEKIKEKISKMIRKKNKTQALIKRNSKSNCNGSILRRKTTLKALKNEIEKIILAKKNKELITANDDAAYIPHIKSSKGFNQNYKDYIELNTNSNRGIIKNKNSAKLNTKLIKKRNKTINTETKQTLGKEALTTAMSLSQEKDQTCDSINEANFKLLRAKKMNNTRINNSPQTSLYKSQGINLRTLNNKFKPFNLGKIDIENIQYTYSSNAPTLLINELSFKDEITDIINEHLPKINADNENEFIDNRLRRNLSMVNCHSLEIPSKPPIDIRKFNLFRSTLSKAEKSIRIYLDNFMKHYIAEIGKKCQCAIDKINELNDKWNVMCISYIIRKRVLDLLLSKQGNQIETILINELSVLNQYYIQNKNMFELICQREVMKEKKYKLSASREKKMNDLTMKIETLFREKSKERFVIWKGLKYDWVIQYDKYILSNNNKQ